MTQAPDPPLSTVHRLLRVVVGVGALAIVCVAVQLTANLSYDHALIAFESVESDAERSRSESIDDLRILENAVLSADSITESASGDLMDASLKDALIAAVDDAELTTEDVATVMATQVPQAADKPDWAWELFGAAMQLNADRETSAQLIESYESAGADVVAAMSALEGAGSPALVSAADAAEELEAGHVSARNVDIIALRSATERVRAAADTLDSTASAAYSDLERAVVQMLASEHAELLEKSGPLNDARLEVEAFARGLAPGLLLDFDWSPLVNDFGYGDSMGGYATWWFGDPGYANIELSNSVAEYWPGDRSKALVAHEVGHAISVRCDGMYDDSSQELIEDWATAWAISMGYLNTSNGTTTYGPPPQSLIDAAAGCR